MSYEVAGSPQDPMTVKRREIIEPLHKQIMQKMDDTLGGGPENVPAPPRPPEPQECVVSKLIPCPRCNKGVAFLVFADHARNAGEMEDYARKMFDEVARINLPTFVIRTIDENRADLPAEIMKIWPDRGPAQCMTVDEFNGIIDGIVLAHC